MDFCTLGEYALSMGYGLLVRGFKAYFEAVLSVACKISQLYNHSAYNLQEHNRQPQIDTTYGIYILP